jgi:hypothetical protein
MNTNHDIMIVHGHLYMHLQMAVFDHTGFSDDAQGYLQYCSNIPSSLFLCTGRGCERVCLELSGARSSWPMAKLAGP